jgi:glycosyltransferase involved in cell wall biosynthesis
VAVPASSDRESNVETPLCSVVIPALNAAATISASIRSALGQTRSDLEVIVVDDGSTDTTAETASRVEDLRLRVLSQPNLGLSAARNAGVREARGEYVAFLDSDDLWLPRYLELVTCALEASRGAGFAYTDAYAFDPVSGRVRRRTAMQRMRPPEPPPGSAAEFLLELLRRNFVYVSTTVRRSVLEQVGGFDERRTAAEDYDLWLRIVAAGHTGVWVPGQHALYRTHPGQMSADVGRMSRNLAELYADLPMREMPTVTHRQVLESRRLMANRELAMLAGEARGHAILRRSRHALGRVRQRLRLGDSWYDRPPAEVAAAFPDLTAV